MGGAKWFGPCLIIWAPSCKGFLFKPPNTPNSRFTCLGAGQIRCMLLRKYFEPRYSGHDPYFFNQIVFFLFVPGRSEPGLPAQSHPGTGRRARRGPAAFHSEYKREALAQQMLDYLAQVLRHVVRRTPVDPPMCLVLSHQRRGLSWGLLASVASVPGGGGVRGSGKGQSTLWGRFKRGL